MADQEENGDRTEQASPQKRENMRKEGNIARSHDLDQALVLLGGLIALTMVGTLFLQNQVQIFRTWLPGISEHRHVLDILRDRLPIALAPLAVPLLAIMGGAMVCALAAQIFQAGFHIHPELAMPKWERMSPLGGLKRLFSPQSLITLFFGVVKLAVVGYVAYGMLSILLIDAPEWWRMPTEALLPKGLDLIQQVAWKCMLPLLVIGAVDYGVRWWKHEREIMMTKQELKEENKQQEGDVQIKHRIRQIARQKLMRRMLKDVPKATVIVTNPTHVAIALKYEPGMAAPLVIAKGEDHMAQRIKKIAAEAGVPILEEPPLARALLRAVQVGQEIPIEFYKAVAEILALIYKARQGVAASPKGLAGTQKAVAGNGMNNGRPAR